MEIAACARLQMHVPLRASPPAASPGIVVTRTVRLYLPETSEVTAQVRVVRKCRASIVAILVSHSALWSAASCTHCELDHR